MPVCSRIGGEFDDIAVFVGTIVVTADRPAAAGVDRQGNGIPGEVGGDGLVAVERDRIRVRSAGEVTRPVDEVPAGVGVGSQLDDIAVLVGTIVVAADRTAAAGVDRQGDGVPGIDHAGAVIAGWHGQ